MTTATKPITLEEFMALPEYTEGHYELIAGEVITVHGFNGRQAIVASDLIHAVSRFAEDHDLGHLMIGGYFQVRSEPDWAVLPCGAIVSNARLSRIFREETAFDGGPDLAIEVITETNPAPHIARKISAYFDGGSRRIWVVDVPVRQVTVHRDDRTSRTLREGETLTSDDASFTVDGFELPLHELFA
jgi:Uma2 family endonuclease